VSKDQSIDRKHKKEKSEKRPKLKSFKFLSKSKNKASSKQIDKDTLLKFKSKRSTIHTEEEGITMNKSTKSCPKVFRLKKKIKNKVIVMKPKNPAIKRLFKNSQ